MVEFEPTRIAYAEINSRYEKTFYDALVSEGMEEGSYAIAAAMRGFRRWLEQHPQP